MNIVAATIGQRMRGQDDSVANNLVTDQPQTFDWQCGVTENDRAWLVDKPGRTRALTANRTLAVFGGNDTSGERAVASALTAHAGGRYDFESESFVVAEPSAPLVCGAQSAAQGGADDNSAQAGHIVVGTLQSHSKEHGHAMTTQQAVESGHVIAFTERTRAEGRTFEAQEDLAYALTNPGSGGRTHSRQIAGGFGVRRLTPVECERLQGFEDQWTAWGLDENDNRIEMSDSVRYRALGNAVNRKVSEWIDQRIVQVIARDARAQQKRKAFDL